MGKFENGNAFGLVTRWKPGQSGNPKGRPKGRETDWQRRVYGRHPRTQFPYGVSGNPRGRPPGSGLWGRIWRSILEDEAAERKALEAPIEADPGTI